MNNEYLDLKLTEYSASDMYPFHMPGHKRRPLGEWTPEQIDITEIEGFDNLHHAEEILRTAQDRLATVFGAEKSYFLVNGSSCGLLAAISAVTKKGDRILVARNCHKAVYHGIYQMELVAEYLYPEPTDAGIQGSILPEQVAERLQEYPDIAAILITSPTYDGVVSDVAEIAKLAHEAGIPLIVDEAHGAHFGFSKGFPSKAVTLGVDLVVESLHKTLPSYTQSATLHVCGTLVNRTRLERFLSIYQSSSPSYVLMAGMDRCVRILEEQGDELFATYEARLQEFYEETKNLQVVKVLPAGPRGSGIWDRDASKILISAENGGVSGQELMDLLRDRYHLELEMAAGHYVTALTSIMDSWAGFQRLLTALMELDEMLTPVQVEGHYIPPTVLYQKREKRVEIAEAMEAEIEAVALCDLNGRIAAEFVFLYPPGIPLIAPGEVWTADLVQEIMSCLDSRMQVQGMADHSASTFLVVQE